MPETGGIVRVDERGVRESSCYPRGVTERDRRPLRLGGGRTNPGGDDEGVREAEEAPEEAEDAQAASRSALPEEIRFQLTVVGGGRRSRRSGLLARGPSIAAEHAMIRPPARSE